MKILFPRPLSRFLLLVTTICALTGCSVLDVVNTISSEEGSLVTTDIAYGDDVRQQLDLYLPDQVNHNPVVIVFFYGGSWNSGTRAEYEFVARTLAAKGHYVAIPDYRLYPSVISPGFVEDGAQATALVIKRIMQITGQQLPLVMMGHSAGAQIAAMLAYDQQYLAAHEINSQDIAGFIGLSGPYNFLPLKSRLLKKVFPDDATRKNSQAINFVDAGDPPALLAHGVHDRIVLSQNSISLSESLLDAGIEVTVALYPEVKHVGIMKPFISAFDAKIPLLDDIDAFIKRIST